MQSSQSGLSFRGWQGSGSLALAVKGLWVPGEGQLRLGYCWCGSGGNHLRSSCLAIHLLAGESSGSTCVQPWEVSARRNMLKEAIKRMILCHFQKHDEFRFISYRVK